MKFDLKNMSILQIVGILFGGIFILALLTIVLLKFVGPSSNTPNIRVTRTSQMTGNDNGIGAPSILINLEENINQLQQQVVSLNSKVLALETENANLKTIILKNNEVIDKSINDKYDALVRRVGVLEDARYSTSVQVIKPGDKQPSNTTTPSQSHVVMAEVTTLKPIQTSSIKVVATLGNRVWMMNGKQEISLTVGDTFQHAGKKYLLQSIDSTRNAITVIEQE